MAPRGINICKKTLQNCYLLPSPPPSHSVSFSLPTPPLLPPPVGGARRRPLPPRLPLELAAAADATAPWSSWPPPLELADCALAAAPGVSGLRGRPPASPLHGGGRILPPPLGCPWREPPPRWNSQATCVRRQSSRASPAEEVAKLPHSLAFHLARPPVSAAISERQASLLRPLPSRLAPRQRSPCSGRLRARTRPDHCALARHGRGPAP